MELLYKIFYRIKCRLNLHQWVDKSHQGSYLFKNLDGSFGYYTRACNYCGKYQYKNGKGKWKTGIYVYETSTQIVHKEAARLAKSAVVLSNELAKFDSCTKQKTKVFMNLLYISRVLSEDYARLKKDIRQLHVSKHCLDIERDKVSGIVHESVI